MQDVIPLVGEGLGGEEALVGVEREKGRRGRVDARRGGGARPARGRWQRRPGAEGGGR